MKRNKGQDVFAASGRGQAMLEYALLSSVVVVLGMAGYMTGWVEGIQETLSDALLLVSLPMP